MRRSCCCALFVLAAGCGVTTPAPPPPPSAPPPPVAAPKVAPAPVAKPVSPPAAPAKAVPAKPPAALKAAPSQPTLDLKGLEQRLRNTEAIGVLTKLSLKNQVDDLVARFRQFHEGHRPPTLPQLRPAFELLLMKVLSLLQDSDKALARDINESREALWSVLSDRDKLAQYQ